MAVSITAVEQDAYPPRVLVSVTGLTVTDRVEVYRVVSTDRTLLRAGSDDSVSDTSFLVIDAELPFHVPVTYLAVVNGTDEYSVGPETYVLANPNMDVLTDAITGQAAEALRVAQPEWEYQSQTSVFQVNGRNIVVSGAMGQYSSELEFYVETNSSAENIKNLLRGTTGGVIQIRDSLGNSEYVAALSFRERRYSNDRTDQRRFIILNAVEADAWASALEARGFTLQDIADYYGDTGTLDDIDDEYSTLLDIAQGDFAV